MVPRDEHRGRVERLLGEFAVVAVVGARQVGKTTLARQLAAASPAPAHWFDLEHPRDQARLQEPLLTLEPLRGLVVLDEVQRQPELFPVLRVLADRSGGGGARFLVLGSASPDVVRATSETLAGRIAYHELPPFGLAEVGAAQQDPLWERGGFPRSFLAASPAASAEWRRQFVRTFLERDVPNLGVRIPASTLRRFWTMLAHAHGQVWNASEFGRAFGVADTTVRRYLDLLSGLFLVRQHLPWFENVGKRQVRAPKVYIADSGLLHTLLGLETREALEGHPKVGASWEGFALAAVLSTLGARPEEAFFWATHAGAALDLLVVRGQERRGFEFKRTATPRRTRSMAIARADLRLDSLDVVFPGDATFPLGEGVRAVGLGRVREDVPPLA